MKSSIARVAVSAGLPLAAAGLTVSILPQLPKTSFATGFAQTYPAQSLGAVTRNRIPIFVATPQGVPPAPKNGEPAINESVPLARGNTHYSSC